MIPAAVTASKCSFNVHVWSWKNSLSSTFGEIWNTDEGKGASEGLISLHYLDDYLHDLTMGLSEKSSESTIPVVQRFRWRGYCNKRHRCNRHHTDEEKNFFSSKKAKALWGQKWCFNGEHCRKYNCPWAHSLDEIFCPTCEVTGDHHMDDCPDRGSM